MHSDHDRLLSVFSVLSRIRALQSRRSARDLTQHFWIEGIRQFVQAVDVGCAFEAVLFSPILLQSDLAEKLVRKLKRQGVRVVRVTPEAFRTISTTQRASGIGAIVRQPWMKLGQVSAARGLCWLVIEAIRSPGNLGTILRTAEATGVGGVIFLGNSCDPFDPAVVRASMGGLFHMQLVRTTHQAFQCWARQHGVRVVGLSPGGQHLWSEFPLEGPIALMIGEERSGLSTSACTLCDITVRLPMTGSADSLNVGVAAGVMLYELLRRKS